MSRVSDKLIEIEELLIEGHTVEDVAKLAGVSVQWVIETQREMNDHDEFEREEYHG